MNLTTTMQLARVFGVLVIATLWPAARAEQPRGEPTSAVVDASAAAAVEASERATWEAFKAGDEAAYRALCCPEFFEISAGGELHSLDDIAKGMRNIVTNRYVMEQVAVTQPAENVCLIRYRLTVDYIEDGKPLPTKCCLAAAVWVRRAGKWLTASYQESRIED